MLERYTRRGTGYLPCLHIDVSFGKTVSERGSFFSFFFVHHFVMRLKTSAGQRREAEDTNATRLG